MSAKRPTKATERYQPTARIMDRIEAGHAASWPIDGASRAALGRDPGDGRVLWSVRWYRVNQRFIAGTDGRPDQWLAGKPEAARSGRAESITMALKDIADAHRLGRP